jgi:hypothetical protein
MLSLWCVVFVGTVEALSFVVVDGVMTNDSFFYYVTSTIRYEKGGVDVPFAPNPKQRRRNTPTPRILQDHKTRFGEALFPATAESIHTTTARSIRIKKFDLLREE